MTEYRPNDPGTIIDHDGELTVLLPSGEQIIFWIEEDGDLSDEPEQSNFANTPTPIGRRKRRLGGTPPFKPSPHPVAVTVTDLHVRAPIGSRLRPRRTKAAKLLVDGVSFVLEPGNLVAAIGPSGAGKSTVLRAVIGDIPSEGDIRYNGVPLNAERAAQIRREIAYVPQSDVLHAALKVREALELSARLRLPGQSRKARELAIDRVLAELLLTEQAETVVGELSGGERKRASVAMELMTDPAVLFLDEPTTGLDPDSERLLVDLLKRLASEGRRTVFMVTHSPAALRACDQVVVVAKSRNGAGTTAFAGPPRRVTRFFQVGGDDFAGVYEQVRDRTVDWVDRFRQSWEFYVYVQAPLDRRRPLVGLGNLPSWASPAQQTLILTRRSFLVVARQQQYARLLLWQAPLVVLLLQGVLRWHNLESDAGGSPRSLLTFTTVAALAMGLVNSSREIVKEVAILDRERTVGMSIAAYLASKVLLLAGLALVQAIVLTAVFFGQGGLDAGLLLSSRLAEMVLVLFLTILCASAGGLAISAVVASDATALVLLPIVLVAQMVLSGSFLAVEGNVLILIAFLTPAYWTFSALAASNDLNGIEDTCQAAVPVNGRNQPICGSFWSHEIGDLRLSLAVLALLALAYTAVAAYALYHKDPVRALTP